MGNIITIELDQADIRILSAMQENSRVGLEALSEIASLSVASVQRRLKHLRDKKIVIKDISILDPDKVSQSMSFIVMVEMERERPEQIDAFVEEEKIFRIAATIWVEKSSQKSIVIGKSGQKLKLVGQNARQDLEQSLDKKVFLQLWVKVKSGWSDSEKLLTQFGYDDQ